MSKPDTLENFEVSYTDLAGDNRYLTTFQDTDAKNEATRLAEEGMAGIAITKVTTTRTGVPFKPPTPEPAPPAAVTTQTPPQERPASNGTPASVEIT